MTYIGQSSPPGPVRRLVDRIHAWRLNKIASADFQRWAASFRLTRIFVKQDAAKIYDVVAGFVYSQTLLACTELGVLHSVQTHPMTARALGARHGLPEARMETLCQAAAAIGLLVRRRDGTYRQGRLGAAILGVPGLEDMILHHKTFYRDMADPVALLKGETQPELSQFWPYVRGASTAADPDTVATYSALMSTSQHLVAEETLDAISLKDLTALTDIGGGTGTFLNHVAARYRNLELHLFDLPQVIDAARSKPDQSSRIAMTGGSFLSDDLTVTGDSVSLIRVLYDHDDDTVFRLLTRVHKALPSGGRLIISEPMSGGTAPNRAGDAYFGFYTLAMTTGRPRSPARHSELLHEAGFTQIRHHPTRRPFLTSVVSACKPG
ncbi:MAG: methyltransferase [Pseudomonadota bacterium]